MKTHQVKSVIIIFIYVLLTCPFAVFSQISEGGVPPSLNYQPTLHSGMPANTGMTAYMDQGMPITRVPVDFSKEDLREKSVREAREGIPLAVAKLITVDYTMENSGWHTTLPGGEKIWQLCLKAEHAEAIMLYYSDLYIPEGGKLFIYNPDKSQILGAYTHRTHPSGGLFATEFVGGDELILEYVASETSDDSPRIRISEIGYGYNTFALREFCGITTYAAPGTCNVNINCEEGDEWQNEKKSVCFSIQRIGNNSFMCTASLMNNTAEDFNPLILTACHCAFNGSSMASESDLKQWLFYFHKERENCSNSSLALVTKTMIGCELLTSTGMESRSDGLLLQLSNAIPEDFDVYYNGWDRSGTPALSGVCIHHPQGDFKKISTFSDPSTSFSFSSDEFNGDTNAHWNVFFNATTNGHGITEGGSSGSPLYNENKLVIGTLTGGNSSCALPRGYNLYGKLSYHWDRYNTQSTRMDRWLDPLNTGVTSLSGRFRKTTIPFPSPHDLKAVNLGQSVSLSWSKPDGNDTPKRYNIYRNNTKIGESSSLIYTDFDPPINSLLYAVSAVYDNNEESGLATVTLFFAQFKAPSGLKAEYISDESNQVRLSWDEPLYEQTIYWGTLDPHWMVGFMDPDPFYYAQRWSADEIAPLQTNTIKAIQFFPIENNTYEIFISQGEKTYSQPLDNASLRFRAFNTIPLSSPFVIDGSKSLVVSIYVSNVGSDYPAVCDDGPVDASKGNLFSFDGIEWYQYGDFGEPSGSRFNFVLSAILSSENGSISNEVLTTTAGNKNVQPLIKQPDTLVNTVSCPFQNYPQTEEQSVALRSAVPATFPEIIKYQIYRNGLHYAEIMAPETTFVDTFQDTDTYYEVTAVYGQIESEKSDRAFIVSVANPGMDASIQIIPTYFTDYITLRGHESVKRVEAISITGTAGLIINNPDKLINTSLLTPGLYFFRIYDFNNRQKVFKAIKKQ